MGETPQVDGDERSSLVKAIDLAVEAVKRFPPRGFGRQQVDLFVKGYMDFRLDAVAGGRAAQKSLTRDVLTYFQEGAGEAVEYFWEQSQALGLPYARSNPLEAILRRGKIRTRAECEFVTDTLVPGLQHGWLDLGQVEKLSQWIGEFEQRASKPRKGTKPHE
jgi:hypothetical protein